MDISILPIAFAVPLTAGLAAIGWHGGKVLACKWFGPVRVSLSDVVIHGPRDCAKGEEDKPHD